MLSPVAIVVGILVHRPKAASAWWLFALGMFLFFLGDVYTYSYPKLAGVEVPFPSLGDAAYLVVYPALMAGLLILVRRRNPVRDRAALIDSAILTIGIGLLSWVFLVAPNIHLSGLSWFAKGVSAAYPLGDILLLAAAIRLAVDAGKRAPSFYMLIASIVSLLAVDSAYGYALLVEGYNGQLGLRRGLDRLSGAVGHGRIAPLDAHARATVHGLPRARLTKSRLILLGGACLIAPAILFQVVHRHRRARPQSRPRRRSSCSSSAAWPASCARRSPPPRASPRCAAPASTSWPPPVTNRSTRLRSAPRAGFWAAIRMCGS